MIIIGGGGGGGGWDTDVVVSRKSTWLRYWPDDNVQSFPAIVCNVMLLLLFFVVVFYKALTHTPDVSPTRTEHCILNLIEPIYSRAEPLSDDREIWKVSIFIERLNVANAANHSRNPILDAGTISRAKDRGRKSNRIPSSFCS